MSPGGAAMASPSSAPSYIARLAPSPAGGDIRCAASPITVTFKRVLAFIGFTDVEVILAGGTAAVAFGSTTAEEFTAQFRPSVVAVAR